MLRLLLCIITVCVFSAAAFPARGEPAASPETAPSPPVPAKPAMSLQLYFENDLFYNTDRYYTNAVQARLISPDLRTLAENDLLPEGISRALVDVPFPGRKEAVRYNISLGLGQQIYTPSDTQLKNPPDDDRPYAGYLYGLLALHAKKENRLDTLELAAGVIGPSALGEQAQNEVHRFRGFETAKGWSHQLHDEPALMLTWTRAWRLNEASRGWAWDFLPHTAVSAGIPFTQAGLGGELRWGWNLPPDYGSSTIRPGAGIYVPDADTGARGGGWADRISLYVFAGGDGRFVAHNTLLDGNTWRDSPSVDKFPFVGELSGGVALGLGDLRLTYTHVYRSKEFHNQEKGQDFGSITLGYTF